MAFMVFLMELAVYEAAFLMNIAQLKLIDFKTDKPPPR